MNGSQFQGYIAIIYFQTTKSSILFCHIAANYEENAAVMKNKVIAIFDQNFSLKGVKALSWIERWYKITQTVKPNPKTTSKASTLTVNNDQKVTMLLY